MKAKLRHNKKYISGTGGGPYKIKKCGPLEDRVDRLLELKGEIDGLNVKTYGCKTAAIVANTDYDEIIGCEEESMSIDEFTSTSHNPTSPANRNTYVHRRNTTPSSEKSTTAANQTVTNSETIASTSQIRTTIHSASGNEMHSTSRPKRKPKETAKMLLKKQIQLQETFHQNFRSFAEKTEKHQSDMLRVSKDIRKIKENKFKFLKEKWLAEQKFRAEELELKRFELDLKERELNART